MDIYPLTLNDLEKCIKPLSKRGQIKIKPNGFSYLDIDDRFIHDVFPLIKEPNIRKPDYFGDKADNMGAHISIVYPEENIKLPNNEENKSISFEVQGLYIADVAQKRHYALRVNSPELIKLRLNYGLPEKLKLYGYWVYPHITIAVKNI